MEFRKLSSQEKAELKRMRPVSQEEFDKMVATLESNQLEYVDYFRCLGVRDKELELRKRASIEVYRRYWTRLESHYKATGEANYWLLEPSKFVADCRYEVMRQRPPELEFTSTIVPGATLDEGVEDVDAPESGEQRRAPVMLVGEETYLLDEPDPAKATRLARRPNDPANRVVNKLAPTVTALIPVILRVLGSRSGHSSLSPRQVEAAQWLLVAIRGRHTAPARLRRKLSAFRTNMDTFRSDLARLWHAEDTGQPVPLSSDPDFTPTSSQQSGVTSALQQALRLVRVCLYLFITLAPPHQAVACEEDMNTLLNAVYHRGLLPTSDRRLLRQAGETLRAASPWEVDTDKLFEEVRALRWFAGANLYSLIAQLHGAEERYAVLVPGQRFHPPHFQCVMRCQAHCVEGD